MSLERLPDEALAHVFSFVDPRDVLRNVLLVSRRVSRVACEPLMWRRNCMRDFRYWHPEHDIKSKLGGKPTAVDWKRLYVWRLRRNERARHALEEIVRTGSVFQPATIASARIEEIIRLGYDVKEFLLAEHERSLKAADDDAGNPDQYSLARRYAYIVRVLDAHHSSHSSRTLSSSNVLIRYWSMAARRAIHRVMAICKWMELLEEPDEPWHSGLMPLDVAFASVGMFVLANPDGDMDEVRPSKGRKRRTTKVSQQPEPSRLTGVLRYRNVWTSSPRHLLRLQALISLQCQRDKGLSPW